jgi:acetolactate synthase-1/2/3 large subunit
VPAIFISGQVFLNQTIGKSKTRQLGVQESDIIAQVKPITKYAVMIKDKNEIKYELDKAFYLATNGRPGPVWLDIPADIQAQNITPKYLRSFRPENKKALFSTNYYKEIAIKILKSKKPIIHFGHGARIAGANQIAEEIVNQFKIPFCLTWNASDLIPSNNLLYAGRPGAFTERGSNYIIQSSDFYLSIGSRLPFMVTGYNSKDFARNAFKVMVDIDKHEITAAKKRLNLNISVCEDAKIFLDKLYIQLKLLNKKIKQTDKTKWIQYCKNTRKKNPILIDKFKKEKKYVNSYFFINLLSKTINNNSIIVTDMGLSFVGTHQLFFIKSKKQQLFTNSGHAPMGWGLPAAIGAFCANRNKKIYCLTGDGGIQMNIQELATIQHHNMPIKIFIYNNSGYLTIKQTQELGFQGRIMGSNKSSGLTFPNYQKIAEAHNISFIKVKNHTELKKQIYKINEKKGPLICELIMSPSQPQIPKMVNRRTPDGKISINTGYEDLYPFLDLDILKKELFL